MQPPLRFRRRRDWLAATECGAEGSHDRRQNGPTAMSSLHASIDLRPVLNSVPAARHVLLELLCAWDVPHDHDDAALLVTELVSNVLDHVGGEATLTVEVESSGDWLRIGVVDGSAV